MGAVAFFKHAAKYLMHFITPYFHYTPLDGSFWQNTKAVVSDIGMYATAFLIFLLGWYLFTKIKKYVVLALMSPILAMLSEKTEQILTQKECPFDRKKFILDLLRGIVIAFRNLMMEVLLSLILWSAVIYISIALPPLSFLLAPASAVLSFAIGAYFFGFSTMDYCSERKQRGVKESIKYIRKLRFTAIGNGTVFSLLFLIPFMGVSCGTIICTVAASLSVHEIDSVTERIRPMKQENQNRKLSQ